MEKLIIILSAILLLAILFRMILNTILYVELEELFKFIDDFYEKEKEMDRTGTIAIQRAIEYYNDTMEKQQQNWLYYLRLYYPKNEIPKRIRIDSNSINYLY